MKRLLLSIILLGSARCFGCSKILFLFPFPSKSHFGPVSTLAEELATKGHEITMLSPFPKEKPVPNYYSMNIDVSGCEFLFQEKNLSDWRQKYVFTSIFELWDVMPVIVDIFLKSETMQALIHSNDKYDLIILESGFFQPSLLAFMHKFNAPVIEYSSMTVWPHIASFIGNPYSFSYIPDIFLTLTDQMTFMERLQNTAMGTFELVGNTFYHMPKHEALVRKYFNYPGAKNIPPVKELLKNISLTLVNSHFSTYYPRPYASNVIQIGGFHLKPAKQLPTDLQKFMDKAENGVIYFSFGSNVRPNHVSRERFETLILALKKVKQQVLFKWDNVNDTIFEGAKNILVQSWLPQQEILAHPKCVLFITHGGYNSQVEVLRTGVPVIGFPFFADQFYNVVYYERIGMGKGMNLESINSDQLLNTINTVISTPSFRDKAKEMAERIKDEPNHPMERAVYWVEYVIRHKGAHFLKPASVYLPYYQYMLLDVIAFVSAIALFLIYLSYKLAFKFYHLAFSSKKQRRETVSKKNK